MTGSSGKAKTRRRGEIETLPSGSLRVRVYAGVDALSSRRKLTVILLRGRLIAVHMPQSFSGLFD
jgi:hypothetical protein